MKNFRNLCTVPLEKYSGVLAYDLTHMGASPGSLHVRPAVLRGMGRVLGYRGIFLSTQEDIWATTQKTPDETIFSVARTAQRPDAGHGLELHFSIQEALRFANDHYPSSATTPEAWAAGLNHAIFNAYIEQSDACMMDESLKRTLRAAAVWHGAQRMRPILPDIIVAR